MGSDWTEVSLSELTTKITKGTTPTKKDGGFSSEGVNYIKSEAVTFDGRIDESKFTFISSEIHKKLKRSQLEESDILMSMAGIHLGKTAIVRTRHLPANTNQALALIRPIRNKIYPDYLFYFLQQSSVVYFINNSTSQSAQPNINLQEIGSLNIKYPEYNEQKAIAHILGSLDDKIELNRQMNETLEAMAQALFKSWFVDFDPVIDNALAAGNAIPDELLERAEQRQAIEKKDNSDIQNLFPNAFEFTEEMGWIPKGWGVSKLGEYIEVKRGGSPRPIHDYLVPKGLPWVKISDATASNSRFLVETKQFIKPEGLNKTTLLKKGSLILSNSATPGLPKFLDLDACIHDGWLHFPKKKIFTDNYLYQLFLVVRQELLMQGNGSVFTNLKTDILKNHMVVVPNIDVLNYFDNWINSFHNKIHAVQIDVDNLSRIRDTLLPKLMSGELRIPDAEALVDEVL